VFFFQRIFVGFELRFANKEITAWGGMGLMKRMLGRIGK
jgi:hypothetical protein